MREVLELIASVDYQQKHVTKRGLAVVSVDVARAALNAIEKI